MDLSNQFSTTAAFLTAPPHRLVKRCKAGEEPAHLELVSEGLEL